MLTLLYPQNPRKWSLYDDIVYPNLTPSYNVKYFNNKRYDYRVLQTIVA